MYVFVSFFQYFIMHPTYFPKKLYRINDVWERNIPKWRKAFRQCMGVPCIFFNIRITNQLHVFRQHHLNPRTGRAILLRTQNKNCDKRDVFVHVPESLIASDFIMSGCLSTGINKPIEVSPLKCRLLPGSKTTLTAINKPHFVSWLSVRKFVALII